MNEPRWRCEYVDAKGIRCEAEAIYRLQFAYLHPFDFVDTCEEHKTEYKNSCRVEVLEK